MFEAAHIFPLCYKQDQIDNYWSCWITIMPTWYNSRINSVQNGILPSENIDILCDTYNFSFSLNICSMPTAFEKFTAIYNTVYNKINSKTG